MLTQGWLPYRLRWNSTVVACCWPPTITIEARGDFVGRGVWNFIQQEDQVDITFDWRLRAEKPLIRYLSFFFKPIFRANHAWALARGEIGLRAELARRAAPRLAT